jgi:hypothetical protein
MHTAMPTMFGPGMNWQRLTMSANSCSLNQRRCSTAMRRAKARPPPKPQSETVRSAMKSAAMATATPISVLAPLGPFVTFRDHTPDRDYRRRLLNNA